MGQLLRLALLFFGLWLIVRAIKRYLRNDPPDHHPPAADPSRPGVASMQPCAHCGVYVPLNEACHAHGKLYCSEEHARADSGK
jgi:ABC-type nickel/cobalt efflux system permease component RcnA